MAICECSPCGREFTGLTAFDKHQEIDYSRRPAVTCLDPVTLGMVRNAHGRWGYPMSDDRREQLAALRQPSAGVADSRVPPQTQSAERDLSRVSG